jgi:ribosomal protein S18 acetylase RimI-like enzyme
MLRVATIADVPGITRVHVDSWKTTYAGLMPDRVLENISYERRAQSMDRFIRNQTDQAITYLVEQDGLVVGFAMCGPNRNQELDGRYAGELYGIYLLKEWQGKGLGRQLVTAVTRFFLSHRVESMIVWALASNLPACRFYEALGGKYVREREIEIQGHMMLEASYGWMCLRRLAL